MTAAAPTRCPVPLTFLEEEVLATYPRGYENIFATSPEEYDAAVARLRERGLLPEEKL